MLRTRVEKNLRITLPESLRSDLHEGEELLVSVDQSGRIVLVPESRVVEILNQTAGMWRGRHDLPAKGVAYVDQLRQGRRLRDLGVEYDERYSY